MSNKVEFNRNSFAKMQIQTPEDYNQAFDLALDKKATKKITDEIIEFERGNVKAYARKFGDKYGISLNDETISNNAEYQLHDE